MAGRGLACLGAAWRGEAGYVSRNVAAGRRKFRRTDVCRRRQHVAVVEPIDESGRVAVDAGAAAAVVGRSVWAHTRRGYASVLGELVSGSPSGRSTMRSSPRNWGRLHQADATSASVAPVSIAVRRGRPRAGGVRPARGPPPTSTASASLRAPTLPSAAVRPEASASPTAPPCLPSASDCAESAAVTSVRRRPSAADSSTRRSVRCSRRRHHPRLEVDPGGRTTPRSPSGWLPRVRDPPFAGCGGAATGRSSRRSRR